MSDASTNITDPIFARAAATPHAIALIEGGTAFSYAAICAAAGRAAQAMLQAGRREGDVIGIAAQGSAVLQLAASLALARMGMTQAWLAPDDSAPLRAATVSRLGITAVLADLDPAWLEGIEAAVPRGEGGSRAWILTQSSGTTATPKTIFVSHSDEAARRARFAPLTGYRPGERYLGLPPLRFYVGLAHALRCLAEGGTLVVPRAGATPQEAIGAIELHDVTYLMCNAVQLENLLHELPAAGPRLPGLRVLRVITSALSPELLSRARQALTPNVFVSYGTNEAGVLSIATPELLARNPEAVGTATAGVTLEIVDEADNPLPRGTPGRLRVKVAGIGADVYAEGAPERAAFRGEWFYPGDSAKLDADGMLTLLGRWDEVMNFEGTLIGPAEIEAALLRHPAVAEAAAFPVAAPRHGQIPTAAVVLRSPVRMDVLLRHCQEELGERAPRVAFEVQALPRNAAGKVLRRELAEMAIARLKEGGAA